MSESLYIKNPHGVGGGSESRRARLRLALDYLKALESMTPAQAARAVGKRLGQIEKMRRENPDFDSRCRDIIRAKAEQGERALQRLLTIPLDTIVEKPQLGTTVVKAAEALGRLYDRDQWGEKVDVSIKQEVNVTVNHVLSLQEQSRKAMLEDMARSRVLEAEVVE